MRGVTGLAIIVATGDPERLQTALTLAASHAALGGRTRLLFDSAAVGLAAEASGSLWESCLELGADVILCQTGLAAAGLDAASLDPRFSFGGMIGLLADLGKDRLVVV